MNQYERESVYGRLWLSVPRANQSMKTTNRSVEKVMMVGGSEAYVPDEG
jgi:hypothetical protein